MWLADDRLSCFVIISRYKAVMKQVLSVVLNVECLFFDTKEKSEFFDFWQEYNQWKRGRVSAAFLFIGNV